VDVEGSNARPFPPHRETKTRSNEEGDYYSFACWGWRVCAVRLTYIWPLWRLRDDAAQFNIPGEPPRIISALRNLRRLFPQANIHDPLPHEPYIHSALA
jgi:hypothetical protein